MHDNKQDSYLKYGNRCEVIVRCDLKQDKCRIVYSDSLFNMREKEQLDTVTALLRYPVSSGLICKEDEADYLRYADFVQLRDYFLECGGKKEYGIRYHIMLNGQPNNICTEFVPDDDYSADNQIVYAVYKNIQQVQATNRIVFDDVLRGLSEDYETICYVDFDEDKVYLYRADEEKMRSFGKLTRKGMGYDAIAEYFIESSVCAEDRGRMKALCSKEAILSKLENVHTVKYSFGMEHDGEKQMMQVKFSTVGENENRHCAVVGFTAIQAEAKEEKEFYQVGSRVLVAEDNEINREILVAILEEDYEVLEAENGEEAMKLVEDNSESLALILTDLEMPVCDGYEFIRRLRAVPQYESIPIIVTTASNSEDVEVKCLQQGASDFVTKPYNPDVVLNRVKSLIKLRESTAMLNIAEKDPLTGFYVKEVFYRYAQGILEKNPDKRYMIIVADIENFKMINERFGRKMGDETLEYVARAHMRTKQKAGIWGRIGSDVFACIRTEENLTDGQIHEFAEALQVHAPIPNLVVKYGVFYRSEADYGLTVPQMCDRALWALNSIKGKYGHLRALYDEGMRQKLIVEQQIQACMQQALTEKQYKVYYQPKHHLGLDRTGGAEALVRWIHPEYGFMNPGAFIPLFERNGFIKKMDEYIWRQVCSDLVRWKEMGLPLVPISINLSRRDFEVEDLAERLIAITDEMGVPHELIHAEVTESAITDSGEAMASAVMKLHDAGFAIELDDFGVGYSSLTTLNSMALDVLKLDMSIIRQDVPGSDRNVLDFCMQLSKMMSLKTVAEGVENSDQVERLRGLGCDYIQGYYYSKPLPAAAFEEYLQKNNK